jgi:hypothetical protein
MSPKCLDMAHSVISLLHSNSAAFGAKRTSAELRLSTRLMSTPVHGRTAGVSIGMPRARVIR